VDYDAKLQSLYLLSVENGGNVPHNGWKKWWISPISPGGDTGCGYPHSYSLGNEQAFPQGYPHFVDISWGRWSNLESPIVQYRSLAGRVPEPSSRSLTYMKKQRHPSSNREMAPKKGNVMM
jgi:hypothetical protein